MNKFYLVKHSNDTFGVFLEKDNVLYFRDKNKWQATLVDSNLLLRSTVFYKDDDDISDFIFLTQRDKNAKLGL